jgi:hypothetical protein
MDILDEDLLHFRRVLNKHGVKYLMAGGFAVNLYGYTRATNDIDLLLKDDNNNRENLANAFPNWAIPIFPSKIYSLCRGGPIFLLAWAYN